MTAAQPDHATDHEGSVLLSAGFGTLGGRVAHGLAEGEQERRVRGKILSLEPHPEFPNFRTLFLDGPAPAEERLVYVSLEGDVGLPFTLGDTIEVTARIEHVAGHHMAGVMIRDAAGELLLATVEQTSALEVPEWGIAWGPPVEGSPQPVPQVPGLCSVPYYLIVSHAGRNAWVRDAWRRLSVDERTWLVAGHAVRYVQVDEQGQEQAPEGRAADPHSCFAILRFAERHAEGTLPGVEVPQSPQRHEWQSEQPKTLSPPHPNLAELGPPTQRELERLAPHARLVRVLALGLDAEGRVDLSPTGDPQSRWEFAFYDASCDPPRHVTIAWLNAEFPYSSPAVDADAGSVDDTLPLEITLDALPSSQALAQGFVAAGGDLNGALGDLLLIHRDADADLVTFSDAAGAASRQRLG